MTDDVPPDLPLDRSATVARWRLAATIIAEAKVRVRELWKLFEVGGTSEQRLALLAQLRDEGQHRLELLTAFIGERRAPRILPYGLGELARMSNIELAWLADHPSAALALRDGGQADGAEPQDAHLEER